MGLLCELLSDPFKFRMLVRPNAHLQKTIMPHLKPGVSWAQTEAMVIIIPDNHLFTVRSLQPESHSAGVRSLPTYIRQLNSIDLDWFLLYLLLRFSGLVWTDVTR